MFLRSRQIVDISKSIGDPLLLKAQNVPAFLILPGSNFKSILTIMIAEQNKECIFLKITYRQVSSTTRSATIHVLLLTSNNLSLHLLQIWFKAALASWVELVPHLALYCRHFHLLSHSEVSFSWKRSTQGSKSANVWFLSKLVIEMAISREYVYIMQLMTWVLLKDDNTFKYCLADFVRKWGES